MAKASEKVKRLHSAAKKADSPNSFVNSARQDVESQLDPKGSEHEQIIKQVENEYQLAWRQTRPKIQEGLLRLKLYNNQRRDKTRVGDPMLFTVHQTVLSLLQADRLGVEFGGRIEDDEPTAENLNALAEFDYDEMDMFWLDYEWNWDSLAWGRGLLYFNEFDLQSKTPIAEVWDPLTFIRDPLANSVNGNRLNHGALRFGGREIRLTKQQMQDNPEYFNLDKLKKTGNANPLSLSFEATQSRKQAQGMENIANWEGTLEQNYEFPVLQWFTIVDGEKCLVELANDRKLVIRYTPLDSDQWPLIDRPCFPMSHDWDGVSVFDIVEDKQRFRAAMLNVYGDSAKADLYPMYLFDTNKIKKQVDKGFELNKWIPTDGDPTNAAHPLAKAQVSNQAQFVMNFLDMSVQRALATPEQQQGVPSKGDQTLGELNIVNQGVDKRYSLSARIFGISEQKKYRRWYEIYERDFQEGIHLKVARIMGVERPEWKEFKRDSIVTTHQLGPTIKIESRQLSEATKMREYAQMKDYLMLALADPTQNPDKLYAYRKLGKFQFKRAEIERIFPLTVDERRAEKENDDLNAGKYVKVNLEDDHNVHIRMHISVKENPASEDHIKKHEDALMIQKVAPHLFPQPVMPPQPGQQPQQQMPGMPGQPALVNPAPEGAMGQLNG